MLRRTPHTPRSLRGSESRCARNLLLRAAGSPGLRMLAVYVSGHGYGHSTRTAEVLRALRARAAELPIVIRTSAPAFLFEGVIAPPLAVRRVECDVGLVQHDALAIDEAGTVAAWRAFMDGWDDRVAGEAAWLRACGRAPRARRHTAARLRRGGGGRGSLHRPRQLLVGLDLRPHRGA